MTFKTALLFPVALAVATLASGCSSSKDVWVLESSQHLPKSVTVVDTLNDRTLWSLDIPADHVLRLQLLKPDRDTHANAPWTYNDANPTSLRYTLWNRGVRGYRFDNQPGTMVERKRLPLPGVPTMVNWTIREGETNPDRIGLTPIITPSTPETERPMGVKPDFQPEGPRTMPDEPTGPGEVEVIDLPPATDEGMSRVIEPTPSPEPEAMAEPQPQPEPEPTVEAEPTPTMEPAEPEMQPQPEAEPQTDEDSLRELENLLEMK